MSTVDRRENPQLVPAVTPAPADAGFFARLRTINDMMFLEAALGSALRGAVDEVAAAASTLRVDEYEPILWGYTNARLEPLRARVPEHPMNPAKPLSIVHDATSFWDVTATALCVPPNPGGTTPTRNAPPTAANAVVQPDATRLALLDTTIAMCLRQCTRKYFATPASDPAEPQWSNLTCGGTGPLHNEFGQKPWQLMIEALAWRHAPHWMLRQAIDAIPQPALDHNIYEFNQLTSSLVDRGCVAAATQLARRHVRGRIAGTFAVVTNPWDRVEVAELVWQLARATIQKGNPEPSPDAYDFIDAIAGERSDSHLYDLALLMAVLKHAHDNREAVDAATQTLINRLDAKFGCHPDAAWDREKVQRSEHREALLMGRILSLAMEAHQPRLFNKLSRLVERDPSGVNLVHLVSDIRKDEHLDEDAIHRMRAIMATARRCGVDMDGTVEVLRQPRRGRLKPAPLLLALAKTLQESGVQALPVLRAAILEGANPLIKDGTGRTARTYLAEDERAEWGEVMHALTARSEAAAVLRELEYGLDGGGLSIGAKSRRGRRQAAAKT